MGALQAILPMMTWLFNHCGHKNSNFKQLVFKLQNITMHIQEELEFSLPILLQPESILTSVRSFLSCSTDEQSTKGTRVENVAINWNVIYGKDAQDLALIT